MFDIRKILIVLIVAVLYAFFAHSLGNAFYERPMYDDFCGERDYAKPMPLGEGVTPEQCYDIDNIGCETKYLICEYDDEGKVKDADCNYCQRDYDDAMDVYDTQKGYVFIIISILAVIAIIIGLALPFEKHILNEWVGTGLLFGGLFALFSGTISYYEELSRFLKPIVLLIELFVVIFVSYKLLGKTSKNKKKK